jgi:hypothetical protein
MKDPLLIGAIVLVVVSAALGIAAANGNLWPSRAAPVEVPAAPNAAPVAALPLQAVVPTTPMAEPAPTPQTAAPEPTASDSVTEEREGAVPGADATYEEQAAARDRAAAHSSRSR